MDKMYASIVNRVCAISKGLYAQDYYAILQDAARKLKNIYNVEPVDIVAALCLFEKGKYDYARILLRRACRDLERIGKQRGLI